MDPEMDECYPARHSASMEVHLTEGQRFYTKVFDAKGTPGNPCSPAAIKEKFSRLATVSHTDDTVAKLLSCIERLETLLRPSLSLARYAAEWGVRASSEPIVALWRLRQC